MEVPAAPPAPAPAAAPAPGPAPAAAPPATASTSALDAVIDEVLGGGDFDAAARDQAADEAAYAYFSAARDALGDDLDAETSAQLNAMMVIPQVEKDAIMQRTNRVARRVLRPLGYKLLMLQGLDPATVAPERARAALTAELSPQQAAEADAEAQRLFEQVYLPEMSSALADCGLDTRDPDEAWHAFGRQVLARRPAPPKQRSAAAIALPAAAAGALVALGLSSLGSWLKRRRHARRRRGGGSDAPDESGGEEADSQLDAASAYAAD